MKAETARWIFYSGTALSLVLFLGLTADTHRQIAAFTHAERLTDQVVAGKKVWHKYNCNDCHTILGFGSYYAPDLTTVYPRRGAARIARAILAPESVTTWRKMPRLQVSKAELVDLTAFFEWVGNIDTHNWPPQDASVRARAARRAGGAGAPQGGGPPPGESEAAIAGTELFHRNDCFDCHKLGRVGGSEGPELTNVGARLTAARIDSVLADPEAVDPKAEMPNPELTDADRAGLVRFLSAQFVPRRGLP